MLKVSVDMSRKNKAKQRERRGCVAEKLKRIKRGIEGFINQLM